MNGYKIINVKGDGNCLTRALAVGYSKNIENEKNYMVFKELIANYYIENIDQIDFIEDKDRFYNIISTDKIPATYEVI